LKRAGALENGDANGSRRVRAMRGFAAMATSAAIAVAACREPPATSPEQVLDAFHAAAARADYEGYFAAWTDASVFLGTDATERWVGQEFRDFAKPHFDSGRGWTYRPRARRVSISRDGRTAWFDELLDNDKYGECRGSGVLERRGDSWVILQYNLGIPMPNDAADELVQRIRAWKAERAREAAP
jgi:hypothetical protein